MDTMDSEFRAVNLGDRPPHRALSLSSIASSSAAATSIMGELSASSLNSSDSDEENSGSPSKLAVEVDRYGFTGGNQYTDPSSVVMSIEKVRIREQKWLSMLNSWDKWMSRRFAQVKNRCRKGIPPSLRGRAWQLLSGSKSLFEQNQGKYEKFLKMEADSNCVEDIEKDLHRQFPFHEMFVEKGGTGQKDLRDVLRAYSVYNREDGYCQAQAPIAAVLLMHMPAEQAFWCMVAMCEHYLQGYFSPGLEAIQVDGHVMQSLLRKVSPVAYKHLEKHNVSPVLYMTEWFMCVFSRTLPWPSVLRLWDMFFCEGIKVVFRCALVLLRSTLGLVEKVKRLPGLYETMESLRKIDPAYMREDRLMFEIVNLKISERDMEHEHKIQKIKWKKDGTGPTVTNPSKEGKRVYRYIPTFRRAESVAKRRERSSSKKISAISANSSLIMKQCDEKKVGKEKKLKKTKQQEKEKQAIQSKHQTNNHNAKHIEHRGSIGEANVRPTVSNANTSDYDDPQTQQSAEPIVTAFSVTRLQPETSNESCVTPGPTVTLASPESCENQTDEITVF